MRQTGYAAFSELLIRIGVSPGDVLMVHSFLPSLGALQDGLEGIYRALRDRLGPGGTLVVPTFTYSFCRGEEFDVRRSPSTVGSFTEFVRCREEAVRSGDPIFSLAAVGPHAAALTKIRQPACFGSGSVFELLEDADFKLLLLGTDYQKSLTYFLHLERMVGVPYRQDKPFTGWIIDETGNRNRATFTYYVRREPERVRMDYNRVGIRFDGTADCRRVGFGHGDHRFFTARALRSFALTLLAEDPYCLVRTRQEPAAEELPDRVGTG